MGNIRKDEPEHREALDKLLADVEAAFTGPSFWTPFAERCHVAAIPRVSEWLNTTGRIVEDQFRRARPARQPTSGHAAIDLAARRVHQPDPSRDRAPRVRAEEPRAHEPDAECSCSYTPTAKTT